VRAISRKNTTRAIIEITALLAISKNRKKTSEVKKNREINSLASSSSKNVDFTEKMLIFT